MKKDKTVSTSHKNKSVADAESTGTMDSRSSKSWNNSVTPATPDAENISSDMASRKNDSSQSRKQIDEDFDYTKGSKDRSEYDSSKPHSSSSVDSAGTTQGSRGAGSKSSGFQSEDYKSGRVNSRSQDLDHDLDKDSSDYSNSDEGKEE